MKSFISYLEDDDSKKDGFVEILEINQSFVRFSTDKNIIILPIARVIKIKQSNSV